jgi:hypothetical protein
VLRIVILLILAAHGIGHSIGVMGGWANNAWGGSDDSWLLTPALGRATAGLEGLIWLLPLAGFLVAAGALWAGIDLWRAIAVASAAVSLLAIALFPVQLPLFSLVGAVAVDLATIIGLIWLQWPAADAVGA